VNNEGRERRKERIKKKKEKIKRPKSPFAHCKHTIGKRVRRAGIERSIDSESLPVEQDGCAGARRFFVSPELTREKEGMESVQWSRHGQNRVRFRSDARLYMMDGREDEFARRVAAAVGRPTSSTVSDSVTGVDAAAAAAATAEATAAPADCRSGR